MEIVVAIIVFLTVVAVIFLFGAAASTPLSVLGERLRSLGGDGGKRAEDKISPKCESASSRPSTRSAKLSLFPPTALPAPA